MQSTVNSKLKGKLLAELSVPSKTFLLGEYLILLDGGALVLTTTPRFRLRVFESDRASHGFHAKSPAGLLMKGQVMQNRFFEFLDPFSGSGGMGASSAQFVLVEAYLNSPKLPKALDWQSIYQKFRSLSSHQEAWYRPSGGDVVSQFAGGLTYFKPIQNDLKSLNWQFDDLEFSLFKTSQKLATHEHLKDIKAQLIEFQSSNLFAIATEAIAQATQAIQVKSSESFVEAFRLFADVLVQLELVSELTGQVLGQIKNWPEVLAAKGCGAMGADVVCVLHKPQHSLYIQKRASQLGLKYLCSHEQIDPTGLRIDSLAEQSV